MDLNAFSDMLEDELLERFTPFEEYRGTEEERALDLDDFPLMSASKRWAHPCRRAAPCPRRPLALTSPQLRSPEAVDWRTHENSFGRPMTTRVKDQQQVW